MGGNPTGHIIPGTGLLILALYVTVSQILFSRMGSGLGCLSAVRLTKPRIIAFGGLLYVTMGSIGAAAEVYEGSRYGHPFRAKEHITMYALFLFAGCIHVLESRGRLPNESWKASLGLAMLGVGLLFYVHSQMQMMDEHNPIESFVHWLLSLNYFVTALLFFVSTVHNTVILAASVGVMHQAFWFYFLASALYSGKYGHMAEQLPMGDATAYFVWLLLLAATIVGLVECTFRTSTSISIPPSVPYTKVVDVEPGVERY